MNATPCLRVVTLAAIAAGYFYFFPFFAHLGNPNENVRVYMVQAIVDHGTFALNQVIAEQGGVDDRSVNRSQQCVGATAGEPCTYSSKAPGTSYLGVPVYLLLRAAFAIVGRRPGLPTTIYALRLVTVILPSLVFLWAFDRLLRRRMTGEFGRILVVAVLALGTMSFTYAHQFAGHQLVAVFAFGSFVLVERARESGESWPIGGAGLAACGAAATEYPAIPVAAALLVYAIWRVPRGARQVSMRLAAGGALPVALVAFYHTVCFGAPWRTGYSMLANPAYARDHSLGIVGIRWPSAEAAYYNLLSPSRGLFFFAPFLLLGLPGIAAMWRRGRRAESALTAFIVLFAGVYQSSVNPDIGGWSIGPRYIVFVTPFLALAAAEMIESRRTRAQEYLHVVAIPLGMLSIIFTFASTIVFHTFPPAFTNPFYEWVVPLVRMDYFNHSVGTWLGFRGVWSALPGVLPVAILLLWLCAGPAGRPYARRVAMAATSVMIASLIFTGLGRRDRFDAPSKDWEVERLTGLWEPPPIGDVEVLAARQKVAARPDDPLAHAALAGLLARQGRSAEALDHYRMALGR